MDVSSRFPNGLCRRCSFPTPCFRISHYSPPTSGKNHFNSTLVLHSRITFAVPKFTHFSHSARANMHFLTGCAVLFLPTLLSRNKHHSSPAFGRFYFSCSMLQNRRTLTLQTRFFISYCVPSLMIWPRREKKPPKTFLNLIGIRPFFTDIPHVLYHGKTPSKLRSKGVFSRVIQSLFGFIQCLNFH